MRVRGTSVVSLKPIELANYYCPEKHAKLCDRMIPLRLGLSFGSPEVREVIGTRWKRCVDSSILRLSPLANA